MGRSSSSTRSQATSAPPWAADRACTAVRRPGTGVCGHDGGLVPGGGDQGPVLALTDAALALPGIDRVEICQAAANAGSGRVPAKLGQARVSSAKVRSHRSSTACSQATALRTTDSPRSDSPVPSSPGPGSSAGIRGPKALRGSGSSRMAEYVLAHCLRHQLRPTALHGAEASSR